MLRATTRFLVLLLSFAMLAPAAVAQDVHEIWFPVQLDDEVHWSDTYGDARGGGRTHKGVDLMAPQGKPVYAAQSGYIQRAYGGDDRSCLDGGSCSAYGLLLYADDGWSYFYLHLNDDTPGRPNGCDHVGGAENAFSPRLVDVIRERGTLEPLPARWDPQDVVRVERGELLGYVGSSGNAGCRIDHLHFETWQGHDFRSANDPGKSNPTPLVDAAAEAGRFWGPEGPIEPAAMARLSGPDRVQTAVALSSSAFPSADVAVVAPAEVYPEALVSAPLAAELGGPVLLTWGVPSRERPLVDDQLVAELQRLEVEDVVVVSAAGSIPAEFDEALAERLGMKPERVRRISADDRYDLSAHIATELLEYRGWVEPQAQQEPTLIEQIIGAFQPQDPEAPQPEPLSPLLALGEHEVDGRGWPDALSAATLAASDRVPILLTRPDELPEATEGVLEHDGIGEVRIVGGPAAVSEEVEAEVNESGHETRRLSGADRYETALAIAAELEEDGNEVGQLFVATGHNFPDAMAAGASIARLGRILVLVDGTAAEGAPSVSEWLRRRADDVDGVTAVGGRAVVTNGVLRHLAVYANWPEEGEGDADEGDGPAEGGDQTG